MDYNHHMPSDNLTIEERLAKNQYRKDVLEAVHLGRSASVNKFTDSITDGTFGRNLRLRDLCTKMEEYITKGDTRFSRVKTTLEGLRDDDNTKKSAATQSDLESVRDILQNSANGLTIPETSILDTIIDGHHPTGVVTGAQGSADDDDGGVGGMTNYFRGMA